MKKTYSISIVLMIGLLYSTTVFAIEEKIFMLQGADSIETILEKIKAPKGTTVPSTFKIKEQEIKVEMQNTSERMISITFNPAHSFTISDKDLFEKIEVPGAGNRINHNLIVADPKSGRIFHLSGELEVSKLELVTPWKNKEELQTLKTILHNMSAQKIERNPKLKKAVKK